MSLLAIEGLTVSFVQYDTGLRRRRLEVVTGLDLHADAGEVVAVIGASGSGKSLLAHAVLGLLPANAVEGGSITFDGLPLDQGRRERLRGREIALVPQSVAFLDPVTRVGRQTRRAAQLTGSKRPVEAVSEAYRRLDLPVGTERRYPHELSGGMARRVLAATATIGRPRLVIADEPTPGLHEDVVAETLASLRRTADDGAAVVLITHDLARALPVADRVVVFHAGTTVEEAPVAAFAGDGEQLAHPYSRALWRALPQNGFRSAPGPATDALPAGRPPGASGLTATGLRFRYDRRGPWTVDGIDLSVRPGEVIGLRGPSGTGKTTLAKLLAGYLRPHAGTVLVDGGPLPEGGVAPVQLIFQHPELAVDPRWRLREILAEAGQPDDALLEELAIPTGLLERFPHELSGGELQRAAVARALMTGAPYLVADEITAMLDPLTQAQIWQALLRRVRSDGLGMLAISHDDELLAVVADRVVDLEAGVPSA